MADCGAVAIRDANRLASGATSGCIDKVTAVAGGEIDALLWRADSWMVVPGDETLASASDAVAWLKTPCGPTTRLDLLRQMVL